MNTRLLWILVTVTVTLGSLMNFFSWSATFAANCIGVSPAACTAYNRGSEIFPSGRTGTGPVSSCSFQTLILSVSSGPITYLGSSVAAFGSLEAAGAAGVAGAACAMTQTDAINKSAN